MKPIFPMPDPTTLFNYIHHSNKIEHEDITLADISDTFTKKAFLPIPQAAGHIDAIKFAIDLASEADFPARHAIQWETPTKAMTNLYWLKDIQKKIMKPIAEHATRFGIGQTLKICDCGPFRLFTRQMGMERPLPDPNRLESLLHSWYRRIGEFHLSIADQLHNPSYDLLMKIEATAWKAHLQLQCIHPWVDGTGRASRLVENTLRLRWGLPWKIIASNTTQQYVKKIIDYEDGPEWQQLLNA
jgi:hypothetical protein